MCNVEMGCLEGALKVAKLKEITHFMGSHNKSIISNKIS
jgi:hypothetical protein